VARGSLLDVLDRLIPVESRHVAFWQDFFDCRIPALDLRRRVKLALLLAIARVGGAPAIHLILEAIEVYGVRKYLAVWKRYGDGPLGQAVRGILDDEFKHEDAVVGSDAERRISPRRIRDIFLGMNDGLVEILGAVSGFFAAFGEAATVLVAASTVAVAGALSMAAGAYIAAASEAEVRDTEAARRRFLGEPEASEPEQTALASGVLVGVSYFAGALIPVLPVAFGARTMWPSLAAAGLMIGLVSVVLAFLSGMRMRRRVLMNLAIIAAAVSATYLIGRVANSLWGISV
jgi:VIT1/CCC1 family predicted Fe2+/Mn2+ transporter